MASWVEEDTEHWNVVHALISKLVRLSKVLVTLIELEDRCNRTLNC